MRRGIVSIDDDQVCSADRDVSRQPPRGWTPQRLAEARRAAGLTRGQLARKAGVGLSTIQLWETGKRSPQVDLLKRVVDALEITMGEIVIVAESDRYPGDWRNLLGLTQQQLSDESGVSKETVAYVERGEVTLTERTATALAAALGISLDQLRAAHRRARDRIDEEA